MATRTELSTVDGQTRLVVDDSATPDAHDVELAARVVRVHCAVMQWPDTERCLNCGWPFPCVSRRWGQNLLLAAGWSETDIAALDTRTGPWS